jgi:hypothetical protein
MTRPTNVVLLPKVRLARKEYVLSMPRLSGNASQEARDGAFAIELLLRRVQRFREADYERIGRAVMAPADTGWADMEEILTSLFGVP